MASSFHRSAFRAGFLAFVVLLVHAILFYKERTVMPDAAIYLFQMVSWHDYTIVHGRFIAMLTEWLPLQAIRAGMSLPHIALVFSLAYPLFHFFCYMCCGLVFKNHRIALALLLFLILFGTHTHYWIVSEQSPGMSLLCVSLAAALHNYTNKWLAIIAYLVAAICLVFVAFAYPLLLFAVVFSIFFLWRERTDRRMILSWGGFYLLVVAYKFIFHGESYEANSMRGIGNFARFFPDYLSLYSSQHFLANCIGKYWSIPLSFIAIVSVYIVQRKWLRLILFASFFFGFLLLVNVCYPDRDQVELYMENLYLILGWFLALPLIYDVFTLVRPAKIAMPVFLVLVFLCVFRIWNMHHFYTGRLNWERRMVSKSVGQKWILESSNLPRDTMLFNWCIPYEIWLLSTMENQSTASIAVREAPGLMPGEADEDPRMFMATSEKFPYSKLPPPYFLFRDTVSKYEHIWKKMPL